MVRRLVPCWRRTAWATLLALLTALLLPTVARATLEAERTAWAEVCTAQGPRWVPVATEGSATVSLHGAWDHCPWCLKLDLTAPPATAGRPEPWPDRSDTPDAEAPHRAARPAPRPVPPSRGPPGAARG